jgi:N-acetylglucosamine-6-phosphate deacetylase
MRLGVAECLVAGQRVTGDVTIESGIITGVGVTPAGRRGLAVPGFIDVQVNGFAGVDFAAAGAADYRTAAVALAATGVTAYQPTLVSLPAEAYPPALAAAAAAQPESAPRLLGVHLEGPFLSPRRHGAHDPANLRSPDRAWMDRMLAAGPVTYVTVAPELKGAEELIRHLTARGITVALGHSDADADATRAGLAAGARAITHLFNAMRPWRHRDPGIAGVAVVDDGAILNVILDGNHLAAETVTLLRRAAPERILLITDAISAAARPDGDYLLGDREVHVAGGVARLADGTLAGSVLTMDEAVRNFVALGATPEEAITAATTTPARLLRRPELGSLDPGTPADVVVLDADLGVIHTLVAGRTVYRV